MNEIPLQDNMEYYKFVQLGNDNFALVLKEYHELGMNPVIRVFILNESLEITNQNFYPVSENTEVVEVVANTENVLILIKEEKTYQLVDVDINTIEFNQLETELPENFEISLLALTDYVVFIGGKMDGKSTGYKYNFKLKKSDILFHHLRENTTLKSIEINKDEKVASFILQSGNEGLVNYIYLNNYDLEGKILFNAKVPTPLGYKVSDFRIGAIDKSSFLIVGEYSLTFRPDENVAGIFSIKLKEREIESSRFYDLSKLKNFFEYLPEKDAIKLRRKISKTSAYMRNIKTKISVEIQKFKRQDKVFMLQASCFKKTKTLQKNYKYEYLNTIALGFDDAGRMIWDNSITYPNENLIAFEPFLLTEAEYYNKNVFFIQKRQYIYRYKHSNAGTYTSEIKERYIHDGFLDIQIKNIFYDQNLMITEDGNMLYYGVREFCYKDDLINSNKNFFIEKIEVNPRQLLTKGEN